MSTREALLKQEKVAEMKKGSFSFAGTSYEAEEWYKCAELAEKAGCLKEETIKYRDRGIKVYEEVGDVHRAKDHAKRFELEELVKYYENLIALKKCRPRLL
ncbi:MAG: hypothetical protein A3I88_02065 [Candidatus Portnoybacteria bacterium RIFCSPLOWO2_12_FULL_39_9]|uniref:Uncharacterized protein n=1 Tax=Candidatus Portnoybacteria bacterium RIFCSPHIGHO2_12_FULL_38_9 TaxID=1801997 RepID=A0A1G2FEM5_9BACT|nr:MAG: hypothetical protein A3H00_01480 [Candidatus Portnoybacteria bacterium RBG_13_40_8]OGZ35873.1 MAG: hypothetical protein A2646_01555 [Candidatus Portnoybacteria bacterium RIFCSPHIGHO2_02_FULL_39_12]OGZ36526.1 MAG: hypothetical protein A3J64_02790 [Candidatus Portnoybacteria bacterium RIFCSPHIGHO2_12_FULL_38_9]OGZ38534.1 MAG: hypothetical protein A3F21_02305 [Candidatus Portnoybacteria bacterium RIFCSPLOWO2_01_FULL_38_39]OGZ41287.1 MAG: hypothetical protein A3I88_02065 [Candidatus Portnoy